VEQEVPKVAIVVRLTTEHQTTIPAEVRRALGLRAGDQVEFRLECTTVTLRKAEPRLPGPAVSLDADACHA
jgi:AbrB family looped-hinge helix DNA binding protein